jgi:hypothetical protein
MTPARNEYLQNLLTTRWCSAHHEGNGPSFVTSKPQEQLSDVSSYTVPSQGFKRFGVSAFPSIEVWRSINNILPLKYHLENSMHQLMVGFNQKDKYQIFH